MSLYPLFNTWDTKYVTVSNTWAGKIQWHRTWQSTHCAVQRIAIIQWNSSIKCKNISLLLKIEYLNRCQRERLPKGKKKIKWRSKKPKKILIEILLFRIDGPDHWEFSYNVEMGMCDNFIRSCSWPTTLPDWPTDDHDKDFLKTSGNYEEAVGQGILFWSLS